MTQPLLPAFVRASRTSRWAALEMMPKAGTKRRLVLDNLRSRGLAGATDEEGMEALHMSGNTYRPRRVELVQMGLVVTAGVTRRTHAGQQAEVWITKED